MLSVRFCLGAVPNFFTRCQPDSITDGASDVEAVSDQNIDLEDVENASFESRLCLMSRI